MSLEHCACLFDRVLYDFNNFLIFSNGLRLTALATPLSANRDGGATKLGPRHPLNCFEDELNTCRVYKPTYNVSWMTWLDLSLSNR